MSRILVVGSTAYDVLLQCDGSFADGIRSGREDMLSAVFLTSTFARHHGGTGANIAWNLRLLQSDPLLVSTVGSDGGPYRELLSERGIDVTYVEKIDDDVTSTAIIGTDAVEHQLGFFHAGADARGTFPRLDDDRDDLTFAIISPRDERVMLHAVRWCKTFGVPYFFDPGQRITSFAKDDLLRAIEGAYGLLCNEFEWSLLCEKTNITEKAALKLTPRLIITRSERGVSCITRDGTEDIPACTPERVMNPTGAGDGLRAGLLFGLTAGWKIIDALRLGCSLASFIVEIQGTLLDTLDRDEVGERVRRAYGGDLPVLSTKF